MAGAATLGAPRPASGGAATRLAPSGAAGEEVSVCEPAAAQAPGPPGGDLAARGSQVAERRQGFGVRTLLSSVPVYSGLGKREECGQGQPRRGLVSHDPVVPCLPQAPDIHTHVFSFTCSLTYCRGHQTQPHRSTHALTRKRPRTLSLSTDNHLTRCPEPWQRGRDPGERVQGTEEGSVWLSVECREGHGAR